jgi:precorrin-6B methylase 2
MEAMMRDEIAEMQAIDRIRATVGPMAEAVAGLTALGLALRARVTGEALPARVAGPVADMLAAMGLAGAVGEADSDALAPVLALIRAELLFGGHVLINGAGDGGWQDRDPVVMQAFGEVSQGFWRNVERLGSPHLIARLDRPGGRFLDVGTGVGWLSIGMMQRWPGLQAVGIEPLPGALALARANLAAAGLSDRMLLRLGRAEALRDVAAYDLVFVPGAFIPAAALPAILSAVRRALRPGGCLMLAVMQAPVDRRRVAAFRAAVWGGDVIGLDGGEALVRAAGFDRMRAVAPAGGLIGFVLADA